KPGRTDRPGPGPARPPLDRASRRPECAVQNGRKLQPCEWAGRGSLGGFKRRWKDTRAAVGTTFRRRSRVRLVGELSKFPLLYLSCCGKCFASFAWYSRRVSAVGPTPLRDAEEKGAPTRFPRERCLASAWETGYTSTTSKHVPPPPGSAGRRLALQTARLESHQAVSTRACLNRASLRTDTRGSSPRVCPHCVLPTVGGGLRVGGGPTHPLAD
ncbi:killin, partial [Cavia porcellus]|uniref:killin n=1 Tax=Cavia porcellus TaxID=10141 RepID=UPI000C87725E